LKEYEWNDTVTKSDKLIGRVRKLAKIKRDEINEKKKEIYE